MRQSLPRISVITPSLNQGRFLEASLRSVQEQEYPDLEHIVLDGGSTDETLAILRRYEPGLASWSSGPDGGQTQALNRGFQMATGEVVCWLNADDRFHRGALRAVGEYFVTHPEVEVVVAEAEWIGTDEQVIAPHSHRVRSFRDLLDYLEGSCLPQPAVFFRRRLVEALGPLDEGLHICMDLDYWLRMGQRLGPKTRIPRLPFLAASMMVHPDQKTARDNDFVLRECEVLLPRYARLYRVSPVRAMRLWRRIAETRAFKLWSERYPELRPSGLGSLVRLTRLWARHVPSVLATPAYLKVVIRCLASPALRSR